MRWWGLVAAVATSGACADTITYTWHVSDTGDGDGRVEPGESALLSLWALMDPEPYCFALTAFDIRGVERWDTGTVDVYENLLSDLTDDGALQPDGDIVNIESFQLAPFYGYAVDDNPIELYRIRWTPDSYSPRWIEIRDADHAENGVWWDYGGSYRSYDGIEGAARFRVVPEPGSIALLTAAGVVALCRKR